MPILLHLSAAACYAVAAWRATARAGVGAYRGADIVFLAAGMLLHAFALAANYREHPRWDIGVGLSLLALFAAVPGRAITRAGVARVVLMLFVLFASLAPLISQSDRPAPDGLSLAHALLAMTAYAFSLATMLLWLELHLSEKMQRMFGGGDPATAAPPILSQEASCFRWLMVSFVLVTLTLVSGAIAARANNGDIFALTHKNIFAALTWLVFGALLLGRRFLGWRGARAKAGFAAGFVFLLLSYFGSRFVLQVILERS